MVALLAEGVGRNLIGAMVAEDELNVALLAEGVGRNWLKRQIFGVGRMSPSSRRAWVEIVRAVRLPWSDVSPSSRRAWVEMLWALTLRTRTSCRPPRGGRG